MANFPQSVNYQHILTILSLAQRYRISLVYYSFETQCTVSNMSNAHETNYLSASCYISKVYNSQRI